MATIRLRFHGSSLIAAYRVPVSGNPNLARNCQLRPLGFIKGDRDPISRPSLSSPLEVGARVCVNRVAARLARERAQARFPWSHCRRPAKEAASLIGIPTRSLLLSPPVCVVDRVGRSALFYGRVYGDVDKLVGRRENISRGFSFSFFGEEE